MEVGRAERNFDGGGVLVTQNVAAPILLQQNSFTKEECPSIAYREKDLLANLQNCRDQIHAERSGTADRMNSLAFPHGVVDLVRAEVAYHDGQRCVLSQREVSILIYLARRPGVVVSRDELLAEVWRVDPARLLTRTVDMHLSNLRRKLRDDAKKPALLKTVNRHGYLLVPPSSPQQ